MAEENIPGLIGSSVGEAAAFAAGLAIAPLLAPYLQELRNATWSGTPTMPLDPADVADWVAEDLGNLSTGQAEASLTGLAATPFARLVQTRLTAPGVGELLQLIRRKTITEAEFTHALRKAKLETEWDSALRELANVKLAPAQIALAVVRSLMKDPGFLPVTLDTSGGKVPAYGTSTLDTLAEASYSGIDQERLRIMVGEIGLPMALQAAASAVFRGIIARADFNRAVLEGDTRPEWADAIFEQSRQIPSVSDYVNARIRGWITEDEMNQGVARHGMSAADAHLLYLRTGRPAAPGQMATAAARGIDGPDGTPMDRTQFLKGIAESDIRPEWGPMLWESRFLYPPLFQITRLVQAGAITSDTAAEWAVKDRYPAEVVTPLKQYWDSLGGSSTDPHITKAQNQLWTTAHRSFIAEESDDAAARTALATAGVDPTAVEGVLVLWQAERDLIRKQLTPAQIKKAWAKAAVNVATGAPWTQDEALAALIERGYSPSDAQNYLNIP